MNNRFAVINFSPNLNIRRRTIKLRQLKAMFTFTTLRLHLHTIEYRMPLRGEFRLEIFQFPYWLSNPKFRPPALSFGAPKKFRSESLTVFFVLLFNVGCFWSCAIRAFYSLKICHPFLWLLSSHLCLSKRFIDNLPCEFMDACSGVNQYQCVYWLLNLSMRMHFIYCRNLTSTHCCW